MHNNLWILGPTCNMKNMASSTAENVNYLNLDLQHKLWYHTLGHPSQHILRLEYNACDGIPNSQRYPLFKCRDYIAVKFHKHKKGHHNKNTTPKPGELFQMDYGFVCGNIFSSTHLNEPPSNEVSPQTMPLNPFRNSYNCYLLTTDVCTRHSWVLPFADKNPPVLTVNSFLKKYGKPNGIVITNKGGGLENIVNFRKIIRNNH